MARPEDERPPVPGWEAATWEGARREQMRRWAALPLGRIVAAQEEMQEMAMAMGTESGSGQAVPDGAPGHRVHEPGGSYDTDNGLHRVTLAGCTPTPLASYLKALGILRLVAEQADPQARGAWHDERFVLASRLDADGLREFLLHEYRPTPVLAPWNGGSGFHAKDNKDGIGPLRASRATRLEAFRGAIEQIDGMLKARGFTERPAGEDKRDFLSALRAELPEEALAWLDAAVLLTEENPKYPPLLGTGGNDGRLDFTNNFMQRVVAVLDPTTGRPADDAHGWLDQALFGAACASMPSAKIGQFSPGGAGGPNQTSGFDADKPLVNPWDFILMLEGALLFAAAATKRLGSAQTAGISYPFTVRLTGAGSGRLSMDEETNARAEFWAPIWSASVGLGELQNVLAEGRVTMGRRPARDGLDFARAVSRLGVERGIGAFQRYAFLMRSGKAYFATPLNRVTVERNRSADLIDDLEESGWLARFRRHARREGANRVVSLARRLEDALFELSATRDDQAPVLRRLLVQLGEIQLYLARSRKARDPEDGKCPPVPSLSPQWLQRGDDGSPEMAVAVALAGLHARDTEGNPRLPMRAHLAPERPGRYPAWLEDEAHAVTWAPGASIAENLAATLHRRLLQAQVSDIADKPLAGWRTAPLADVAALLAGDIDERRVAALLPGLMLVRMPGGAGQWADRQAPLPLAYRLLKPLFCTDEQLHRVGVLARERTLPLRGDVLRRLAADDVAGAVELARRRLRGAGIPMASRAFRPGTGNGRRLLAALMIPISNRALAALLRLPSETDDTPETAEQD